MAKNINLANEIITPSVAMALLPAFTSAYALAEEAAETFDFLGGSLKRQILPHLKNWAVEYELDRRVREGLLPFDSNFVPNSRKNHKHLELRQGNFVLTVSQTPNVWSLPRDCVFRNDYCLNGQIAIEGFEQEFSEEKSIYGILTHGYGSSLPSFVCCGIPTPDMRAWAQQVDLHRIIRGMTIVDSTPVDEEIKLEYKNAVRIRLEEAK